MKVRKSVRLFDNMGVRFVYDNATLKWWYSAVDTVQTIVETNKFGIYLSDSLKIPGFLRLAQVCCHKTIRFPLFLPLKTRTRAMPLLYSGLAA